ncbi:MAG: hypothetical protein IJ228_03895 [Succinivibrio sp.]|nr:hypothetical protein [Succinivibrio sp.]
MKIRVSCQDLSAALAKLAAAAGCMEGHHPEFNPGRLLLYVRHDQLFLRVCDCKTEVYVTLKAELLDNSTPLRLAVSREMLQARLGSLSSTEYVVLNTAETDRGHNQDHEALLPVRNQNSRQLQLKGTAQSVRLNYTAPFSLSWADEPVQHTLLINEHKLKFLLEHSLFCCNETDFRSFYRGPQFKVSTAQPHLLMCNTSDGEKLAAVDGQLLFPAAADEDLQAILHPETAQLLRELLNENSAHCVTLQFSEDMFCALMSGCLLKTHLAASRGPNLRAALPVTNSELRVDLKMLLHCVERVRELDITRPRRLQLLCAAGEDLTAAGADLKDGVLKNGYLRIPPPDWPTASLLQAIFKDNSQSLAAASAAQQAQSAQPEGCLFLEYRDAAAQIVRLKVEGSAYRGSTCRLQLSPYAVHDILQGLSFCAQIRIAFDRQDPRAVIFTPADPDRALPVTLKYALTCNGY